MSFQPIMGSALHHTSTVQQNELTGRTNNELPVEVQSARIATTKVTDEQLLAAIEKALKSMQGPATHLDFSIHEGTKQILVKVKDTETGEIIREIPAEKNLDLLANLWKMAGIIIDEKR